MNRLTGCIKGQITDSGGEPLPGVVISVTAEPESVDCSAVTRPDGRYSIDQVLSGGPYRIEAKMVGFQTQIVQHLFVKANQPLIVNIMLDAQIVEDRC